MTDPTKHARAKTLVRVGQGRFTTSIAPLRIAVRGDVWRITLGESTLPDYGFVDTTGFAAPPDHSFRLHGATTTLTLGAEPATVSLRDAQGRLVLAPPLTSTFAVGPACRRWAAPRTACGRPPSRSIAACRSMVWASSSVRSTSAASSCAATSTTRSG